MVGFYCTCIKQVRISRAIFLHDLKSQQQTITSPSSVYLLHLIRTGFLRVLAALQQSPQRPTYLPKWPAWGQGSLGAATSPVTGNKQQEGERRKSGEVGGSGGEEGGRWCSKHNNDKEVPGISALFLSLTHTYKHTHSLVGQRFRVDNNSDRKMAKKAFTVQV